MSGTVLDASGAHIGWREYIHKHLEYADSRYRVRAHQMCAYVAMSKIMFRVRKHAKQIERQTVNDKVRCPIQLENVVVLDQGLSS